MENQECFICKKHQGEIIVPGGCIYEDEFVYVGHIGSQKRLIYKGYLIVDLKRHVHGIGDMSEDEAKNIGFVLNQAGKALKEVQNAEHIYCFVQGDAFPHFHMHVIPRYPNTPHEYWNPLNLKNWQDAHCEVAEIEELCARLNSFMTTIKI